MELEHAKDLAPALVIIRNQMKPTKRLVHVIQVTVLHVNQNVIVINHYVIKMKNVKIFAHLNQFVNGLNGLPSVHAVLLVTKVLNVELDYVIVMVKSPMIYQNQVAKVHQLTKNLVKMNHAHHHVNQAHGKTGDRVTAMPTSQFRHEVANVTVALKSAMISAQMNAKNVNQMPVNQHVARVLGVHGRNATQFAALEHEPESVHVCAMIATKI